MRWVLLVAAAAQGVVGCGPAVDEVSPGLLWSEIRAAGGRVSALEEDALAALTGSEEESLALQEVQRWVTLEGRLVQASNEWDLALKKEREDTDAALRAVQHGMTILDSVDLVSLSALAAVDRAMLTSKLLTFTCLKARLLEQLQDRERALGLYARLAQDFQTEFYLRGGPCTANGVWALRSEAFVRWRAGTLYLSMGHLTRAESEFERAVVLDRTSAEAHLGLGLALDLQLFQLAQGESVGSGSSSSRSSRLQDDESLLRLLRQQHGLHVSGVVASEPDVDAGYLGERVFSHLLQAVRLGSQDLYAMVRIGQILSSREEWEAAAHNLARAAQLWPESPQVHLELGKVLFARGMVLREYYSPSLNYFVSPDALLADKLVNQAVVHLQQASWLDETSSSSRLVLGELLLLEGRANEASGYLVQAVNLDSKCIACHVLLAKACTLQGQFTAAADHLRVSISQNGVLPSSQQQYSSASLFMMLGDAETQNGQWPEALASFKRALRAMESLEQEEEEENKGYREKNDDLSVSRSDILLSIARAFQRIGQWENAREHFDKAKDQGAGAQAHAGLGWLLLASNGSIEEDDKTSPLDQALRHFESAVFEHYSLDLNVLLQTADMLVLRNQAGDLVKAERVLQRATRAWPDSSQAFLLLGKVVKSSRPQDDAFAIESFQRALALQPECVACLIELAAVFTAQGKLFRALESLTAAHRLQKTNPHIHLELGNVLAKLGRDDAALEAYRKVSLLALEEPEKDNGQHEEGMALDDESVVRLAVNARINSASLHLGKGAVEEALRLLQEAIDLDPNNSETHERLALILAANGQHSRARFHEARASALGATGSAATQGQQPGALEATAQGSWANVVSDTLHRLSGTLFEHEQQGQLGEKPEKDEAATKQVKEPILSPAKKENYTSVRSTRHCAPRKGKDGTSRLLIEQAGSLFQLAGMFASQGLLEEALECFEQVSTTKHVTLAPAAKFEMGVLLRERDLSRAIDYLLEAAKELAPSHPKHLDATMLAVGALASIENDSVGDAGQRLALLSHAASVSPQSAVVFHALGVEFQDRKDWSKALSAYQEASMNLVSNFTFGAADTFYRAARATLEIERRRNGPEWNAAASELLERALTAVQRIEEEGDSQAMPPKPTAEQDLFDLKGAWRPLFPSARGLGAAIKIELGALDVLRKRNQRASDLLVQASQTLLSQRSDPRAQGMLARCFYLLGQVFASDRQWTLSLMFHRASVALDPTIAARHKLFVAASAAGQASEAAFQSKQLALDLLANVRADDNGVLVAIEGFDVVRVARDATAQLREAGDLEGALELTRKVLTLLGDENAVDKKALLHLISDQAKLEEAKRYILEWRAEQDSTGGRQHLDSAVQSVASLSRGVQARLFAFALEQMRCTETAVLAAKERSGLYAFPVFALAFGKCLEENETTNNGLTAAAATYGMGLASEFTMSLDPSLAPAVRQGNVDAHLLVVPHLLAVEKGPASLPVSPDTAELHGRLARLRNQEGFPQLAAVHSWWHIFASWFSPKPANHGRDLHRLAARSAWNAAENLPANVSARFVLLKVSQKHLERLGNSADITCELGRIFLALGEPRKALDLASDIARFGVHAEGRCECRSALIAQAHAHLGQKEAAAQHYRDLWAALQSRFLDDEQACGDDQDGQSGSPCGLQSVDALVDFARGLQVEGNMKEAEGVLGMIIDRFRRLVSSSEKLGEIYYAQGTTQFHLGMHERAVKTLSQAVVLLPRHISARNNLGAALFRHGDDASAAVEHFATGLRLCEQLLKEEQQQQQERVEDNSLLLQIELERCKVPGRLNLALIYEHFGEYDAASAHVRSVLKLDLQQETGKMPSIDRTALQRQLARLLRARGKIAPAVSILRDTARSLQLELKSIDTTEKIAEMTHSDGERQTKGCDTLPLAEKIYADLAQTMRDLAIILMDSGHHEEAIRTFRRILLMQSVDQSVATTALSGSNDGSGTPSESTLWDVLDALPVRAIEHKLKAAQPLVDLGNAYYHAGNLDQAKRLYQWCAKLFPKESSAHNNLGVIAFQEEQWQQATSFFQKALELNPGNQVARAALEHVDEDGPAPWMITVIPSTSPSPLRLGTIVAPHLVPAV